MTIVNVTLAAIALSFLIAYIYSTIKIKKMSEAFAKLFVAQATLEEFLSNRDNSKDLRKTDQDIHKENFIKFLSDSRDWAFDYIERSQETIKEVIEELNSIDKKELSDKLLTLLPENIDDRR